MKKNRIAVLILAMCLICVLFTGCGQTFTVRLNENYPGGNTTEISVKSGKTVSAEEPVREGYLFEGWYTDENGVMLVDEDSNVLFVE